MAPRMVFKASATKSHGKVMELLLRAVLGVSDIREEDDQMAYELLVSGCQAWRRLLKV